MAISAQEAIASRTEEALEDLIRSVRRMPSEKITWQPLSHGRTALDQLQECATAPLLYLSVINGTEFVSLKDVRKGWNLDESERRARVSTRDLVLAIRNLPDERLETKVEVPRNGEMTLIEVLWMHLWNLNYHLGAINYIQTLYGDTEMV